MTETVEQDRVERPQPAGEEASAPPALPSLEYVGFGLRGAAQLLDFVINYLLTIALAVALGIAVGFISRLTGRSVEPFIEQMNRMSVARWALYSIAGMAYHILGEAIHGSTPGKMILRITVRSSDGGYCGFGQALIRSLAFWIDSLVFGLPALISMRGSPSRQRLGDKWAGTVVVRIRSLEGSQRRTGACFLEATLAASAGHCLFVLLGTLV